MTAVVEGRASANDEALIRRFLDSPGLRRLPPAARRDRRNLLRRFSQDLGTRGLPGATTEDVARWLDRPVTPTTRYTYLGFLHAFYAWALSEDIVSDVPTAPLRAPRRSLEDRLAVEAKGLTRQRATLDQLARAYITERMRRGEVGPSTARNQSHFLTTFALFFGDRPARLLSADDLAAWAETLGPMAPATRRWRISTVKGFCAWAVRRGYLSTDPSGELPRVRLPRYLPRQLEVDAISRLLEVCPDERAALIVLLEVQQGLRAGEVAALQFHDVSFADRTILVHGKGGHQRLLPIVDETWDALLAYLDRYPATAGPLIRSYREKWAGLRPDTVSGMVSDWLAEAGLKRRARDGVSGHALRHSCAGGMVKSGAHLLDVKAALGHASIQSTQRYLPTVVNDLREAMGGRRYRGGNKAGDHG